MSDEKVFRNPELVEERLNELTSSLVEEYLFVLTDGYVELASAMSSIFAQNLDPIKANLKAFSRGKVSHVKFQIIEDTGKLVDEFGEVHLDQFARYMQVGTGLFVAELETLVNQSVSNVSITYTDTDLKPGSEDSSKVKRAKSWLRWRQRVWATEPVREIAFRELVRQEFGNVYLKNIHSFLHALGLAGRQMCNRLIEVIRLNVDVLRSIGNEREELTEQQIIEKQALMQAHFDTAIADFRDQHTQYSIYLAEFNSLFRTRLEVLMATPGLVIKEHDPSGNPALEARRVRSYHTIWRLNQQLFHNHLFASVQLQALHLHLIRIVDRVKSGLDKELMKPGREGLVEILELIDELRLNEGPIEPDQLAGADLHAAEGSNYPDARVLEEIIQEIRYAIERLPQSIALRRVEDLESFEQGKRLQLGVVELSLQDLTNFITKTHFIAPLEDLARGLPSRYKQIVNQARDGIRLVIFNFGENANGEASILDRRQLQTVLQRAKNQVAEAADSLNLLEEETEKALEASLATCREHLKPRELILQESEWSRNIRGEERLGGLRLWWSRLRDWVRRKWKQYIGIWRKTQTDLLMADFEVATENYANALARSRDFVDRVNPEPMVMRLLPFYYKQLFIGKQSLGSAQMSSRDRELKMAQVAVKRMSEGLGGAMMVVGESLSGKTYFCEHVATTLFSGRLYRINPPAGGSSGVADLKAAFSRSLQSTGSIKRMISAIPRGAVFLLGDLELWWERRTGGDAVIRLIGELIEEFGKEHYFILNTGVHTYPLLRQLTELEEHIISTIVMAPFSRENLRKTIMIRHYSGGLQMRYKGESEKELSPRMTSRLFARFFEASRGNIGYALHLWLAQISSVQKNEFVIEAPVANPGFPNVGDADTRVMLAQFVLHRQLTLKRLCRIYPGESRDELSQQLEGLIRAGLIIEGPPQVFSLDPFAYPHLVTQLKAIQLI